MSNPFSRELFDRLPVVGILRGFTAAQTREIVDACVRGGLTNIEITMNTADAAQQIRDASRRTAGGINVGAGTVTTVKRLDEALEAGASFIVTPAIDERVINECVKRNVPIFPGALSPTEVQRAWELGAALVKVFPAEAVGPAYIRALKAPLPHVRLMPTGGVDLSSLRSYVEAGASGFGVGTPLFDRSRVADGEWDWIAAQCKAFAAGYAVAVRI